MRMESTSASASASASAASSLSLPPPLEPIHPNPTRRPHQFHHDPPHSHVTSHATSNGMSDNGGMHTSGQQQYQSDTGHDNHSDRQEDDALQVNLPVKLWGLDPLYWSSVKLLIADIMTLKTDTASTLPDAWVLGPYRRPIQRVEVVGVIVAVIVRQKNVAYSLDDGSGILHCTHWFRTPAESSPSTSTALNPLPIHPAASSSSLYRRTPRTSQSFISSPFDVLSIGNVVRARGRILTFRERKEMTIETLYVDVDPHAECVHWLEVLRLHRNVYSKPSSVGLEMASNGVTQCRLATNVADWAAAKEEAQSQSGIRFTLHSLMQEEELYQLACKHANYIMHHRRAMSQTVASTSAHLDGTVTPSFAPISSSPSSSMPMADIDTPTSTPQSCMQAALDYLYQLGTIIRLPGDGDPSYELLSLQRHVIPLVFQCVAGSSMSAGVHRSAIQSAVHSKHPNVSQTVINQAIARLEQQSDICAWDSPDTYVCSNPAAAAGIDIENDANQYGT